MCSFPLKYLQVILNIYIGQIKNPPVFLQGGYLYNLEGDKVFNNFFVLKAHALGTYTLCQAYTFYRTNA